MKLWSGRFEKDTDELFDDFHSSISFDKRLYKYDIYGSIAHAKMLAKRGIISENEANQISKALKSILDDIEKGRIEFDVAAEDIHMNIEKLLIEHIGDTGKKLHTARSRNDQVALDVRMFLKDEIKEIQKALKKLITTLLNTAEKHLNTIMPGYTHLQRAQPITFAHHLMAYVHMFLRDIDRLSDCYKRTDVMPLGSGALAATTFDLDREFVAKELGFSKVSENSMDAVSDRDFVIEFCATSSILMMHLSRFCEEIILWSSLEFDFIELDDAYSTGSSIMPQKKNPDAAELIRGKTGRVYGNLIALLTMMKGLALAYNKDMQEDKEALFDTIDTVKKCVVIFEKMIATINVKEGNMLKAAQKGFTNATELADYLVRKGVPFRQAHEITGNIVKYCIEHNKTLEELTLDEYKEFYKGIENDIYSAIDIANCVAKRRITGGPAPSEVKRAINSARERLK
ncbi:argininosuccinate lyase [Peptococcaceae bacterium]|nr:argininosuccinate lyase [Peptococcaceae bacterium]